MSTAELDTWHYIKKIKKLKKEEGGGWATPLAGLEWPNHPMAGKKNLFNGFWPEPPSRAKSFKINLECLSHPKG